MAPFTRPGFVPHDLTGNTPLLSKNAALQTVPTQANRHNVDVEYYRDIKPVLTVSAPRSGASTAALGQMRFGLYDNYSGLDRQSLLVTASFPVNGKAAGSDGYVEVDDVNGQAAADAVRLVRVP